MEYAQYAGRRLWDTGCGERKDPVSNRVTGMIDSQNVPVKKIGTTVDFHVTTQPLVVDSAVPRATYLGKTIP
jgi:hypothetical protein